MNNIYIPHLKWGRGKAGALPRVLVTKESRNIGVGRAIIYKFVEYCHLNKITNCYLWPDGETAERIYYQAGFRYVETKQAGRAIYRAI